MGIFEMLWDDKMYFAYMDISRDDIIKYIKFCLDGKALGFNNKTHKNSKSDLYVESEEEYELLSLFGHCETWDTKRKKGALTFTINDIIREFCDPFI